jgi:hypothetical protein
MKSPDIESFASSFSITHCSSLSSGSHRETHLPCKRSNKQKKDIFPNHRSLLRSISHRLASEIKVHKADEDDDKEGIIFPLQNQARKQEEARRQAAHKPKSITFSSLLPHDDGKEKVFFVEAKCLRTSMMKY